MLEQICVVKTSQSRYWLYFSVFISSCMGPYTTVQFANRCCVARSMFLSSYLNTWMQIGNCLLLLYNKHFFCILKYFYKDCIINQIPAHSVFILWNGEQREPQNELPVFSSMLKSLCLLLIYSFLKRSLTTSSYLLSTCWVQWCLVQLQGSSWVFSLMGILSESHPPNGTELVSS
jgi:hypothetical protein